MNMVAVTVLQTQRDPRNASGRYLNVVPDPPPQMLLMSGNAMIRWDFPHCVRTFTSFRLLFHIFFSFRHPAPTLILDRPADIHPLFVMNMVAGTVLQTQRDPRNSSGRYLNVVPVPPPQMLLMSGNAMIRWDFPHCMRTFTSFRLTFFFYEPLPFFSKMTMLPP